MMRKRNLKSINCTHDNQLVWCRNSLIRASEVQMKLWNENVLRFVFLISDLHNALNCEEGYFSNFNTGNKSAFLHQVVEKFAYLKLIRNWLR